MAETVKLVNYEAITELVSALSLLVIDATQSVQLATAAVEAAGIATDEAIAAAALVEMPIRVVSVFEGASDVYPFFSNLDNALDFINDELLLQDFSPTNPVSIKYFSSTHIFEDIYSLNDNGILIESPFDAWKRWNDFGGDLILATTLYDINLERLNKNINLEKETL
jgi:hypothetical protein